MSLTTYCELHHKATFMGRSRVFSTDTGMRDFRRSMSIKLKAQQEVEDDDGDESDDDEM